jgi:MarR family transcriptional regulator, organic hydroperoxide resistance regulator
MKNLQMQTLHLQNAFCTSNRFLRRVLCVFQWVPPMYHLPEAFPYLVTRLGVRMSELFSRTVESYGVTLPMYRVMAALWERNGQHLGELSEMTSVEISTLSRLVGVMQRRRLLSRTRPDSNARTVEINLTRSGRALVERLIPIAQRHEEAGLRGLAANEVDMLKKNLVTIYRNLDSLDREISEEATVKKRSAPARTYAGTRPKADQDKRDRLRPPRGQLNLDVD